MFSYFCHVVLILWLVAELLSGLLDREVVRLCRLIHLEAANTESTDNFTTPCTEL